MSLSIANAPKVNHDARQSAGPLSVEWRWTGFTPASLLNSEEMARTLRYLGAIPRQGIRYVRIHYLLEMVRATGLETEHPRIDWSELDRGLDRLVENRLVPFFELMGNPSGFFTDFCDEVQKQAWKRFVMLLALHLQERYGQEEVEGWYFETWNEPDLHLWTQSDEAFLIYYDGCSEGLKAANPRLKFGGPGTARTLAPRICQLLAHVDRGINHYTGRQDVRMDFLSIHEKGAWAGMIDVPVSPERMVAQTRLLREYLREHHPRLLDIPLMNNECDPQVGWKDPHTWRGLPFYAAIMAKGLLLHQQELVDCDQAPFVIFGNDNGFIGDWSQRTQLARFGRKGLPPGEFDLIKKPALTLMTALSLLGESRIRTSCAGDDTLYAVGTDLGDAGFAALTCRAANVPRLADDRPLEEQWQGLPPGTYTRVQYRIDETHSNPFRVWEQDWPWWGECRHPPSPDQLAAMRREQELTRFGEPDTIEIGADGSFSQSMMLPLPGVHVTLLLRKAAFAPPEAVRAARAEFIHGSHPEEQVLITWQPPESRAVTDHHIEWQPGADADWAPLAHPPLLDGSFVHVRPHSADAGQYRITPVDVWGRRGPPVCVPVL